MIPRQQQRSKTFQDLETGRQKAQKKRGECNSWLLFNTHDHTLSPEKVNIFPFYHLILFHKLHKPRKRMRVWEATRALLLTHTDTEPNTKHFLLHWISTPRSIYWLKTQRGCFPGSNANLRLRKSRFNSLPHHILPVQPWAINISVPQSFHL